MNYPLPQTCLRCPHFDRNAGDSPRCKSTQEYIAAHVKTGSCPEGKWTVDESGRPVAVVQPTIAGKIAHGVAGLAKAALGVGRADDVTIEKRQAICATCPHAITSLGVVRRCNLCGCALRAKMVIATERCPAGKW